MTALARPDSLGVLELSGRDRERLLHGLTTGEVRGLAPGSVAHGFFTGGQGRILADYRLLAREASLLLLVPREAAAQVATELEKYRLASEVEIRSLAVAPVALRGPGAAELAAAAEAEGLAVACRDPLSRSGQFVLFAEGPERSPELAEWIRREAEGDRLRVDPDAFERSRIEAGELRFGVDFGPENFPQETGREDAVSYTKGCFLGQEVVARIHYRGGVQKRPCGLRFEAAEPPPAGVELRLDGRAVGRATSVALSPALGAIGLGILHQRGAEPGTRLELDGGAARVVALPFETR